MQISTSSWHYRLLKVFGGAPGWWRGGNNTDLCSYMRKLVLVVSFLAFAAFDLAVYPYGWYAVIHLYPAHGFMALVIALWGITNICLGIAAMVAVAFGLVWLKHRWEERHPPEEAPEPGIIATYIKGLKERACVIVEYKP